MLSRYVERENSCPGIRIDCLMNFKIDRITGTDRSTKSLFRYQAFKAPIVEGWPLSQRNDFRI